MQTFAAYNSNIQGSLGKLQGQGVTHFWRIRMEKDPNGGLCNLFSVYLGNKGKLQAHILNKMLKQIFLLSHGWGQGGGEGWLSVSPLLMN